MIAGRLQGRPEPLGGGLHEPLDIVLAAQHLNRLAPFGDHLLGA
jgi:hypothetical protein